MPLQLRRGTTAERLSIVPLPGEPIYDTDLDTIFIGNGIAAGGISAITGITSEDAQDIVGQMFLNGQHDGLIFTYGSTQDVANRIDVRLDLSSYDGELAASAFRGSLYANDSTLLVNADTGIINASAISGTFGGPVAASQMTTAILNADNMFGILTGDMIGSVFSDSSTLLVNGVDGSINLDGTVKGDIIPAGNELYDLGSNSNRFKDLYLSGSSIFLGSAVITATGSAVNLPAGSTVAGVSIGTGSGTGEGVIDGSDYNINIVADDSTVIINSATKLLTGELIGNVTGNLSGNVTGIVDGLVIGAVKGSVFGDDSSLIVDGASGNIFARNIEALNGDLTVTNGDLRLVNTDLIINNLATIRSLPVAGSFGAGISINNNLQLYESAVLTSSDSNADLILGSSNPNYGVNIGDGGFTEGRLKVIMTDGSADPTFFNNGVLFANSVDRPQCHIINYYRTRGGYFAQTGLVDGDVLSDWRIWGHCGTPLGNAGRKSAASIRFTVDGTPTTSSIPTKMAFSTANGVGTNRITALEISKNQEVKINILAGLATDTISLQSAISNGSIRIYENNIEGENSNEDLVLRPSGTGTVDFDIPTQGTVGAAGAASALPATPSTYFKIRVGGTEYVVPAYAVS